MTRATAAIVMIASRGPILSSQITERSAAMYVAGVSLPPTSKSRHGKLVVTGYTGLSKGNGGQAIMGAQSEGAYDDTFGMS